MGGLQLPSQTLPVQREPWMATECRDAKVAEIVAKWASGRNEPWPLTVALEVADAIAALYPEAGK